MPIRVKTVKTAKTAKTVPNQPHRCKERYKCYFILCKEQTSDASEARYRRHGAVCYFHFGRRGQRGLKMLLPGRYLMPIQTCATDPSLRSISRNLGENAIDVEALGPRFQSSMSGLLSLETSWYLRCSVINASYRLAI